MSSRDRTALFVRYRDEARALHRRPGGGHEDDSMNGGSTSARATMITNMKMNGRGGEMMEVGIEIEPDWVCVYNELKGDMSEVETLLNELGELYARHLLPSFGIEDTSQLEHDIRIKSHNLTTLLHTVEQKVRGLYNHKHHHHHHHHKRNENEEVDNDDDDDNDDRRNDLNNNNVELIIRRNVQKRFATPLQSLSMNFRKRQKTYLEKLRAMRQVDADENEHHRRHRVSSNTEHQQLVSIPLSDDDSSHTQNHDGTNIGSSSHFQQQETIDENMQAVAEERRRELERVSSNINDLATLVKDIAALVVDQGTVLDRVDYNLEDVRTKTTSAVRELRLAERYQRKRHALCCIIILAIGCGINTMILIYKWT